MYSPVLLLAAALALPLFLQGLRAWHQSRSVILLFVVLALAGVMLQAALAGSGRWLGPGSRLRDLHALPALISMVALPMTLFTFATLARRAGFPWARVDWGHGAVCILAVVLLLAGLPGLMALKLMQPACWQDVVWYVSGDPGSLACPGQSPGAGVPPGWLVGQLTLVAVMAAWAGLGAGLWRRQDWPWLLAGMVAGIALMAVPPAAGPVPSLVGRLVAAGAMVLATVRQVRQDSSSDMDMEVT